MELLKYVHLLEKQSVDLCEGISLVANSTRTTTRLVALRKSL